MTRNADVGVQPDEERWHRAIDWPLTISALAFLAAYAWSVLDRPTGAWLVLAETIMYVTWAFFAFDFFLRLYRAERRVQWFLRHLHEFVVVALPMFRPLKLLRLLTVVTVFQRSIGGALRGRVVLYAVGGTALLVFVAALAVLEAERGHPDASIQTFHDAVWWAGVTVTTVGYGDFYPVTATGRLVALSLMVAGIALVGVVTATFASWMLQRVTEDDEERQAATQAQVRRLTTQIEALRAELRENRRTE